MVFDSTRPELGLRKYDDGSPHTAKSTLYLEYLGGKLELAESEYLEGETFEEVQRKAEDWAQRQMDKVVRALMKKFSF